MCVRACVCMRACIRERQGLAWYTYTYFTFSTSVVCGSFRATCTGQERERVCEGEGVREGGECVRVSD